MTSFRILSSLALTTSGCISVSVAPTELALVEDGRSTFVILYAGDAPGSVRKAAQELQPYIEKSTNAKFPIAAGLAWLESNSRWSSLNARSRQRETTP